MSRYDTLLEIAEENNISICEKHFKSNAKGLCKGNKIAISKGLSGTEKTCVLAEELGHYFTTVGNILDQSNTNNKRQERKARVWGYDYLVKVEDLVTALLEGCSNSFEVAEFLGVTENCLLDAIAFFRERYGAVCYVGKYKICFTDCGYYVVE